LINAQEVKTLSRICERVSLAERGKIGATEAFREVRTIYDEMAVNKQTSAVALAIASIAASGAVTNAVAGQSSGSNVTVLKMSRSDKIDTGIVGGAIGGAIIGGAIGGAGGAIIGGVIGGIVGGIGTACATSGKSGKS